MKFYYSFRRYPHSKRATDLSNLAAMFLALSIPIFLIGALELILDGFRFMSGADIAWLVVSFAYVVLYFTVIVRKIEDLARKDYSAAIKAAKENTVDKE